MTRFLASGFPFLAGIALPKAGNGSIHCSQRRFFKLPQETQKAAKDRMLNVQDSFLFVVSLCDICGYCPLIAAAPSYLWLSARQFDERARSFRQSIWGAGTQARGFQTKVVGHGCTPICTDGGQRGLANLLGVLRGLCLSILLRSGARLLKQNKLIII